MLLLIHTSSVEQNTAKCQIAKHEAKVDDAQAGQRALAEFKLCLSGKKRCSRICSSPSGCHLCPVPRVQLAMRRTQHGICLGACL